MKPNFHNLGNVNWDKVASKLADMELFSARYGSKTIQVKNTDISSKPLILSKTDVGTDTYRYKVTIDGNVFVDLTLMPHNNCGGSTIWLNDYMAEYLGSGGMQSILHALSLPRTTFTVQESTIDKNCYHLVFDTYITKKCVSRIYDMTKNVFLGSRNAVLEQTRNLVINKGTPVNTMLMDFVRFSRPKTDCIDQLLHYGVFNLELLTIVNNYGFNKLFNALPRKLFSVGYESLSPGSFSIGHDTLDDEDSLARGGYVLCATKRFARIAADRLAKERRKEHPDMYVPAAWEQWCSAETYALWRAASTFPLMYCAMCPTTVIQKLDYPVRFKILDAGDLNKIFMQINAEADFDLGTVVVPKPKLTSIEEYDL